METKRKCGGPRLPVSHFRSPCQEIRLIFKVIFELVMTTNIDEPENHKSFDDEENEAEEFQVVAGEEVS
jgi:hypothetical protein